MTWRFKSSPRHHIPGRNEKERAIGTERRRSLHVACFRATMPPPTSLSEEAAVTYPLWLARFLVQTGIARFLPVARRLSDGAGRFLRYYSDAVLSAPVEELLDSAYFPTAGPDVIDLNLPAPRYESSLSVGRLLADRRGNPPPRGIPELRTAIADLYLRRNGWAVDAQREVFVTHGASGAYAAVLDAFVNPGD